MSDHHDDHAPKSFWTKYVFSTDHKVIGIQFTFTSLLFVILGGLFALGVRYQLAWPMQHVPYKWMLPGQMTNEAPEPNLGLWNKGGEIRFNRELTLTSGVIPAGATGTLQSFPSQMAVTVPEHARVLRDGELRVLSRPVEGYVDRYAVMGDYNYLRQQVIAVSGTQVSVRDDDGEVIETFQLRGRRAFVPSGRDGAQAAPVDTDGNVLLGIRPEATRIEVEIPAQTIGEGEQAVDLAAATVTVNADQVQYIKDSLTTDAYLQLFTMHASIMIFFVIIPMLVGGFGNFLIPLMIGARDMAFPKLNMLSYWIAFPAGLLMLVSFWTMGGPAGGGWTMYPTLSTAQYSAQFGATLWIMSVGLVGFSSVVGSLNYVTTIVNMRAPGMSMFRMPLTVWSLFITSILALFGTPVLTAAMAMLMFDRAVGTMFFLPAGGGQPLLFQHLFWFYSHPAVYIMILPAMGVASDVLATFARKPIFGYRPMIYAMAAIAGLGFIVWGHHMFQSGMNPVLGTTFMASTIMIAVPSAIKTFNWLGTLWGGSIRFTSAMLNAIAFVSMFVIGGLSGIFMASSPVDIYIHDTYFIVAHIHYVLFGGSIFGIFAGIYYWFPKMFGRSLNERWGVIHWVMTIISFNGTFFLMHVLGIGGHPRRYASILEYPTLEHLQPLNVVMTLFALSMGLAQIPFFYNVFASLPPKLARSVISAFGVALIAPAVIGLTYWAAVSGETSFTGLVWVIGEEGGYASSASLIGYVLAIGGFALLTAGMLWGLPTGGRVAVTLINIPLLFYFCAVAAADMGGSLVFPDIASGDPTVVQSVKLAQMVFWSPMSSDILIALGIGVLASAVVVGLVYAVWEVGRRIHAGWFLQRSLYVIFLPAFLCPFLVRPDMWVYLGSPQWVQYGWTLTLLTGLPGLVYLLAFKPADAFGATAGDNPWHANSLEWATTSPPPLLNFDEIPTVHRGPYEYSSPVVEDDYLPQPRVLPAGVVEPGGH